MRPGTWPDTAVRTSTARAFLDGVERDVDAVSLTSEMTADFALAGGGGDPVTDGTVTWPQPSVVAVAVPQPFQRAEADWPPVTGSPLVVEVSDGAGQWWRQVTGLVDSSSGSLAGPQVESAVVDYVDRLSAQVWHDSLLLVMPPVEVGELPRRIGLTGPYVTDQVARAAGFYATPPAGPLTLLSVPCMGSMWPEVGLCKSANEAGDTSIGVRWWQATNYGLAAMNPDCFYRLADFSPGSPTSALNVTMCLSEQPAGAALAVVVLSDVRGFTLSHTSSDQIAVTLPEFAGGATIVALDRNGAERATVRAYRDLDDGVLRVLLRLSDGREVSGTSAHPDFSTAMAFDTAKIYGSGDAAVGAVIIDEYAAGLAALNAPRTATLRFIPTQVQGLSAMPALRGETALSLLVEQARAQGASFWIDSQGGLCWADRGILEADPVMQIKTTDLSVDGFDWTDNLRSVRERIVIKRRAPAVSRSGADTITLWQGSAQELGSGQVVEEWVEPSADIDWIMPDYSFVRVNYDTGYPVSAGSKVGVSYVDDTPSTADYMTDTGLYDFTSIPSTNGVRIVHEVTGTLPAGKTLVTKIPDNVVALPRTWRGMNLPILRGRGKVQWSDSSTSYATGGPGVGTYEHDAGWWVQAADRITALRDWLLSRTTDPTPIVTAVQVDPDPRLELGDKITVRDATRTGIEFDLVITRIAQSWGGDRPTMALAGRVTRVLSIATITDPESPWDALLTNWKAHS